MAGVGRPGPSLVKIGIEKIDKRASFEFNGGRGS